MDTLQDMLLKHIDIWTAADIKRHEGRGRSPASSMNIYGIEKLRQLILEMALCGRLVEQDFKERCAQDALQNFHQNHKEYLNSKGRGSCISPTLNRKGPFELPKTWVWATLPELAKYRVGKTPSTKIASYWGGENNKDTEFNWVSIADLNNFGHVIRSNKKITRLAVDQVFKSPPELPGTLLMSFKLTLGKISILDVPAYHNEAIISISPNECVLKEYLFKILPSRAQAGNLKSAIKGNTLNSESIASLIVPLPPIEEQGRIVKKINELMSLCCDLEKASTTAEEVHDLLLSKSIEGLINSSFEKDFLK